MYVEGYTASVSVLSLKKMIVLNGGKIWYIYFFLQNPPIKFPSLSNNALFPLPSLFFLKSNICKKEDYPHDMHISKCFQNSKCFAEKQTC